MKKSIQLLALFLITNLSFGQITLEHSYNSELGYDGNNIFYTQNGISYYTFNGSANSFSFFNSSHSLINTVIIPADPNYHIVGLFLMTDKLFNADDLIEFIVRYEVNSYPTTLVPTKLVLLNENGTILKQFSNHTFASVKKADNNTYKLIVSNSGNYDVYSLTGTLSTLQQSLLNKPSFAFPNPANDIITISNKLTSNENAILEIYKINGSKIYEKKVTSGDINLDISGFSSGVYIYKLNGETNKFVKK